MLFLHGIIFLGILRTINCLPETEIISRYETVVRREELDEIKSSLSNMSDQIEELKTEKQELADELNKLKSAASVKQETSGLQTCHEVKKRNPTAKSGYYWLDPARNFIPVQIFCDMSGDGVSIVEHSSPETDIAYCQGDGCFNISYDYGISNEQLLALIEMSESCHQKIKFKCKMSPLKNLAFGRFYFGWWMDRNQQKRFYFDGNQEDEHVCGCKRDNSCAQSMFNSTCNCDSGVVPIWTQDSGVLTNKDHLPVRGFSYGGFVSDEQAAGIAVGKLTCSGTQTPPATAQTLSTCSSLKKSGVSYDGYFMTKAEEEDPISLSYCKNSNSGYQEEMLRMQNLPLKPHTDFTRVEIKDFSMRLPNSKQKTPICIKRLNDDCFRNTGWAPITDLEVTGTIGQLNVTGGYIKLEKSGICLFETNKWLHIQEDLFNYENYRACELKAKINNKLVVGSIFQCSAGDTITFHTETSSLEFPRDFSTCYAYVWKFFKIDLFFAQLL